MFSVRYAAGQFDFLHTMAFAQTNAHREAMHRLLRSLLCVCSLLDSKRESLAQNQRTKAAGTRVDWQANTIIVCYIVQQPG